MINKQHQPRIVAQVQVMTPECDIYYLELSKEPDYLSGAEVTLQHEWEDDSSLMRPIKGTIERLGTECFSCISFVASREEVRKVFGLDGEGLFSPGESEKELRIEAWVPTEVSENMAGSLDGTPISFSLLYFLIVVFSEALRVGAPAQLAS